MKVREAPLSDPAWCELVSSHPDATPFHLPEWTSAVADCYRLPSFVLAVSDAAGETIAGVPVVAVRGLSGPGASRFRHLAIERATDDWRVAR